MKTERRTRIDDPAREMKTERRTRIDDPADAMRAAFALVTTLFDDPDFPDERLDGTTLRPVEYIERCDAGKQSVEWAFEIRGSRLDGEGVTLRREERILVEA